MSLINLKFLHKIWDNVRDMCSLEGFGVEHHQKMVIAKRAMQLNSQDQSTEVTTSAPTETPKL